MSETQYPLKVLQKVCRCSKTVKVVCRLHSELKNIRGLPKTTDIDLDISFYIFIKTVQTRVAKSHEKDCQGGITLKRQKGSG